MPTFRGRTLLKRSQQRENKGAAGEIEAKPECVIMDLREENIQESVFLQLS